MTSIFEFEIWLSTNHPKTYLLPHQWAWIRAMEEGGPFIWAGGLGSGKTFVMKLYREYKAWTLPIEELEKMWISKPKRNLRG